MKPEADTCKKFIGYDALIQKFGTLNPKGYRLVPDGAVDTSNLEVLYTRFSVDHPANYTEYSLSMSDVLELYNESDSSFYYLDSFDFKQVNFEPPDQEMTHTQTMQF